jgi:hypothetical protein
MIGRLALAAAICLPLLAHAQSMGVSSNAASPVRPSTTVGALPVCNAGSRGAMYIVTDALVPVALATIAAGGAAVAPVICNGTVWIVG